MATTPPKSVFTAAESRAILEGASKDGGEAYVQALTTVLGDVVDRLERLEGAHRETRAVTASLVKPVRGMQTFMGQLQQQLAGRGGAQGAPAEAEAGTPGQPSTLPNIQGGQRIGADGQPITDPAQLEVEALMDAATTGLPSAAAQVAPPTQRPGSARNGGGPRPVPPRGGVRVGAPQPAQPAPSGPVPQDDAAQADLEAMMDAAAGPRA
jgi:hypothetical protein